MKFNKLLFMIMCLTLLVGCHTHSFQPIQTTTLVNEEIVNKDDNMASNELTVWTHNDIFETSLTVFSSNNPDIDVNIEVIEEDLVKRYHESLIGEQGPDIYVIPDHLLGEFSGISGFENLKNEAYYDRSFFDQYPEQMLKKYMIENETDMFAFPLLFFPYVTFYRADILEEYGYAADPKELSSYINNAYNWTVMAKEMKEQGKHIIESEEVLLEMMLKTNYYFNDSYDYLMGIEPFLTTKSTAIHVAKNELSANVTIWNEDGREAIQNDELIMFQMPSYFTQNLKDWFPDQAGKWGMTKLPSHLSGVDKIDSMSIAISNNSKNKDLAWDFIKHMSGDMLHMYRGIENDPYFINQDLEGMYQSILEDGTVGKPHPLDSQVDYIWDSAIKAFYYGEEVSRKRINDIDLEIRERIKYDQRALKSLLQEQN